MNQGEIILAIRTYERDIKVLNARCDALDKKIAEMDELIKSPIRRAVYATRQKRKQESDV